MEILIIKLTPINNLEWIVFDKGNLLIVGYGITSR